VPGRSHQKGAELPDLGFHTPEVGSAGRIGSIAVLRVASSLVDVPRALHAVSGDGLVAGRAVCLTPVTLLDPADWAWPDDGDHEGPLCWVTSSSRTGRRAFEPRIGFITSSPGRSPPHRCCRLRWRGGARACGGPPIGRGWSPPRSTAACLRRRQPRSDRRRPRSLRARRFCCDLLESSRPRLQLTSPAGANPGAKSCGPAGHWRGCPAGVGHTK
jgi:hypothetical protein